MENKEDKHKKSIFKRWWFWVIIVIAIIAIKGVSSPKNSTAVKNEASKSNASSAKSNVKEEAKQPEEKQRIVAGKATDLGAGIFEGGKDIPVGLYDAAPVQGQGNFTINSSSGQLLINSILGSSGGLGVLKVRTKISNGDKIMIRGLDKVHFEPVTTPFVKSVQKVSLYSGYFTVGEDIPEGRYIATPASGNGNFVVYHSTLPIVNEILGSNGVKNVTINLKNGDSIYISGLDQVNLVPTK